MNHNRRRRDDREPDETGDGGGGCDDQQDRARRFPDTHRAPVRPGDALSLKIEGPTDEGSVRFELRRAPSPSLPRGAGEGAPARPEVCFSTQGNSGWEGGAPLPLRGGGARGGGAPQLQRSAEVSAIVGEETPSGLKYSRCSPVTVSVTRSVYSTFVRAAPKTQ